VKSIAWFFIIQLSLTALIPKSDFSQLDRVGNLYTHFSEYHANEDHKSDLLAFLDFISEHYSTKQHKHQDEDQHDQLPFKNFTSCGFYHLVQLEFVTPIFNNYNTEYTLKNTGIYPKGFSSSIDHPPSV